MYKLSVPFKLNQVEKYGAEVLIKNLKEVKADYVFLAFDSYIKDENRAKKTFDALAKAVPIFKAAGFKVGAWFCGLRVENDKEYTHITSPNGKVSRNQVCPSDEDFGAFAQEFIKNVAKCAPDVILLDDDYRYGFLDCGLGCACKNHRAYMEQILGEKLPEEGLSELIFGGGKNKYRSAYLKANGHFLKEFAKNARVAIDSVNPDIRLGLCACITTWDFDGVSAAELSRIMAGNTEPFLRLIGAPYWAHNRNWGNRLQDVIELTRMERTWCGEGIEILAEGDTYPRPRFTCSANALEGFDTAFRAAGVLSGIHKYIFDYYAAPEYDNGYKLKHLKNQSVYKAIEENFADKTAVGVRVYEAMAKFENMEVPPYHSGKDSVQNMFFSPAAKLLAAQTIPSVYEGLGTVGMAFGENVKYIDDAALDNGLIIDGVAAQILQQKGIDTGIQEVLGRIKGWEEFDLHCKNYLNLGGSSAFEISVKDGAEVLSEIVVDEKLVPLAYTYQNANCQKFLVFTIDAYGTSEHALKQSIRGQQIAKAIVWMGKKLPAQMLGNPDCYMLCKENERGKAVWIGNFFGDECLNTTVTLDKDYKTVEFINCTGTLDGNKVIIDNIHPYASVGFSVK